MGKSTLYFKKKYFEYRYVQNTQPGVTRMKIASRFIGIEIVIIIKKKKTLTKLFSSIYLNFKRNGSINDNRTVSIRYYNKTNCNNHKML